MLLLLLILKGAHNSTTEINNKVFGDELKAYFPIS
jgi:hypothetical protein